MQVVRLVHHRRNKEVRRALPAPLEKQVVHATPVKRANSEQLQRVQLPVWLAQLASIKVTPGVLRVSHASQASTKIRTAQLLVNHV